MERYCLVLECGATSLRAVAVSEKGEILHLSSFPNAPSPQEGEKDFLIWDVDEIWRKFTLAIRQVIAEAGKEIFAVTVTTLEQTERPSGEMDSDLSSYFLAVSEDCSSG